MRTTLYAALGLVALFASGGCQLARDLLPRTHTSSRSPDGRHLAFVYQGLNPDPPDDHLYLGSVGQPARYLRALAPDADWSGAIVWSPNSRTVGFVINEQRLALFDVATAREIATLTLVKADGYPGCEEARAISIANDGIVTFDRYRRATMLLQTRQGVIEAPVTIFGTYGRPIHRAERLLGRERLQVATTGIRPGDVSSKVDDGLDALFRKAVASSGSRLSFSPGQFSANTDGQFSADVNSTNRRWQPPRDSNLH